MNIERINEAREGKRPERGRQIRECKKHMGNPGESLLKHMLTKPNNPEPCD